MFGVGSAKTTPANSANRNQQHNISGEQALQRLLEGNQRFLRGEAQFPTACKETLADLTKGQNPYATILGCSDSRVPPELIFDASFGELFIVRVAGNIFSAEVMGSLQYAGAHLRTPLFMVLGHESCGAVRAALDTREDGVRQRARIQALVNSILPGLPEFESNASDPLRMARAVEANVRWSMRQIFEAIEDKRLVQEQKLKLVGAVYEIATGRVRLLA